MAVTPVHIPEITTVSLSDSLSIAPAMQIASSLVPFAEAITELEAQAERAVIDSADKLNRGSAFLSLCKSRSDQLETWRKSVKGPIDDYGRYIQSLFMPLINRADAAKGIVSKKIGEFMKAEEARIKAEQEALRKQQEEEALKMAAEQAAAGNTAQADAILEAATMAPTAKPYVPPQVRNDFGGALSVRGRWIGEVSDMKAVLKAILEEKLPISMVTIGKLPLNTVAGQVKVEGVHHGIKITYDKTVGVR